MDPASEQEAPRVPPVPVGIDASGTRTETSSMGSVEVPANHYGGAQTQRSLTYFSIGNDVMPAAVYRAYAHIKKACAIVNARHGGLPQWKADLIGRVAGEEAALRSGVSADTYDRVVAPERLTRPGEATAAGGRRGEQMPRGGEEPSGGQRPPGGGEPDGGTP